MGVYCVNTNSRIIIMSKTQQISEVDTPLQYISFSSQDQEGILRGLVREVESEIRGMRNTLGDDQRWEKLVQGFVQKADGSLVKLVGLLEGHEEKVRGVVDPQNPTAGSGAIGRYFEAVKGCIDQQKLNAEREELKKKQEQEELERVQREKEQQEKQRQEREQREKEEREKEQEKQKGREEADEAKEPSHLQEINKDSSPEPKQQTQKPAHKIKITGDTIVNQESQVPPVQGNEEKKQNKIKKMTDQTQKSQAEKQGKPKSVPKPTVDKSIEGAPKEIKPPKKQTPKKTEPQKKETPKKIAPEVKEAQQKTQPKKKETPETIPAEGKPIIQPPFGQPHRPLGKPSPSRNQPQFFGPMQPKTPLDDQFSMDYQQEQVPMGIEDRFLKLSRKFIREAIGVDRQIFEKYRQLPFQESIQAIQQTYELNLSNYKGLIGIIETPSE